MIEGMIGATFVLTSFVSGYFFRGRQAKREQEPAPYIEQDQQLTPDMEQQLNNIMNAWKG